MEQDQPPPAKKDTRFKPGQSGNPSGRPKREVRTDQVVKPFRQRRTDGFANVFTGHGTSRDRRSYTKHRTRAVQDIQGIDLRRGNWLAARICEAAPDDGFRRAYTFKGTDKKTDEDIQNAIKRLGINHKYAEAVATENACGGAALLPVFDGANGDLSEPLDIEDPRVAEIHAIHLLEPRELVPETWYTDINEPKWMMPETYRLIPLSSGRVSNLQYQLVHESRMVIFPGIRITREQLPGQRLGWGDSKLTRVTDEINDFGLSWGSAAAILHDFSQGVLKLDKLIEMLKEEGGEELVKKRLDLLDMARSAMRLMPLDKEDDFIRQSSSVAGLSDLLIQFMNIIAGAAGMPTTRLFGRSPAGMNATGESDMRAWYDEVGNEQVGWTPGLEWLIRLLLKSTEGPTGGDEPEMWSIEWRPLWTPSEKEQADTRLAIAQADAIYFNMGAASSDDIANSRWKGDTFSAEMTIDWAARAAQQKLDAQQALKDQAALEAMRAAAPDPNAPPAPGSAGAEPAKPPPAPPEKTAGAEG